MASTSYPKRYAQAIYEIALEQNGLEKWQSDLDRMVDQEKDADVAMLFESQKLNFEDKVKIVDARLTDISPMARNLACLLISRNQMSLIGNISAQYRIMVENYLNVQHAEVTTAVPLDDQDKEKIRTALSSLMGKQILLETRVDAGIIGGMVARIDGKLLDGSTRSKLAALKSELAGEEISRSLEISKEQKN